MDFSETILVYDIKVTVGRCSQLNEYMKLYEYQSSRSFIAFIQGHSDSTFQTFSSLETARPIEAKFHLEPPCDEGQNLMLYVKDGCHVHI